MMSSMKNYRSKCSAFRRSFMPSSRAFILALSCGAGITLSSGAQADGCLAADGSVITSCAASLHAARIDGLLTYDPSLGRSDTRLNGTPWIAPEWLSSPVAVTPTDASVSVRTSARQLGGFANSDVAKKIEGAKALAPADFKFPSLPPVINPKLDVWTSLDVQNIEASAAPRATRGGVGADYKVTRDTLVGVSIEADEARASDVTSAQDAFTVSTYFAVRPIPTTTFDAKAAWGENSTTFGDTAIGGTHSALSARVRGDWMFSNIKVSPTLGVAHGTETGAARVEKSTFTVEPRISRPFALENGESLEPFLTYRNESEFDGAAVSEKIGGGVTLAKPDAYSLSVTTHVEETLAAEQPNVEGRFQLNLPIR
ncbi:MAG: hypothetical protein CTY31_11540 [Hyphomicrobium sp.]|nr:MAG: hypothetical protein CTY39_05165 [Hyphomicrobium sp.]PPC99035.1 MAG: hypothetical protein CTY31_11540 [Hyphomicrobium sp.]